MEHRHLDSPGYTLAAIDDVIARGSLGDWIELDAAAASDARIGDKIRTVVMARSDDESSINHDFWRTRMTTPPGGKARR